MTFGMVVIALHSAMTMSDLGVSTLDDYIKAGKATAFVTFILWLKLVISCVSLGGAKVRCWGA